MSRFPFRYPPLAKRFSISRFIRVGIAAAVLMLGVSTCFGPPKFWRNYEGWKEAEVTARLGKPIYDSRVTGDDPPGQPYTLGWYHGVAGEMLGLNFDTSGKVVKQWHDSK